MSHTPKTAKVTVPGWVIFDHEAEPQPYRWIPGRPSEYGSAYKSRCVAESCPLVFDLPAGFDPRLKQVEFLKEKERELNARFAAAVTEIHAQIARLQAIEHTEAA